MHFGLWLVSFISIIGGLYFGFESGLISTIWETDVSKLSFVIVSIFMIVYIRLGTLLFKMKPIIGGLDEKFEPGYEAADMCMAIGMLGTVIGFILMTSEFAYVDFSNVANIQELFSLATTGMSTALYTTATGLIASILLRASHYIYERILR